MGYNTLLILSRDGGIGRRAGLKIRCQQWREGSSPSPGTTEYKILKPSMLNSYWVF